MTLRAPVGIVAALVACVTAGSRPVAAATDRAMTVFLTLPMTNGFADASHSLVEARDVVRQSLGAVGDLRLVDEPGDADVVVTVLGRGKGHAELTAALRRLDRGIVAPPVPIGAAERYIQVMITIGACWNTPLATRPASDSCYRRLFVGVGFSDLDARQRVKRPPLNSWEACANAVARDVRAWLTANASRLLAGSR